MEKIRILHVIPDFGPGGAERLLVSLIEAFDRDRFDVAAASLYAESGTMLEKEMRAKGFETRFLDKRPGLDPNMIPRLFRLFGTFRPDVVHTHLYALRYALLPMLLCRIPARVHTVHNIAQKEVDRIARPVHWFAFRAAGVVPVSVSEEVARTVRSIYGGGIDTPVVYNGIQTGRFASRAGWEARRSEGDVVVLHVGRFEPQKNHLLLIEAFASASKEYRRMHLRLAGDGSMRPAVEEAVSRTGLRGNVSFLGVRDDVPELLRACDVFVLSSDYEGVPLTVLEAMAAGRPVVATAVGGVPELVEDGVTGILVPPGDPGALARAILRAATDPGLRRSLADAARRRALERFDVSKTAREYEALYLKLLGASGRA